MTPLGPPAGRRRAQVGLDVAVLVNFLANGILLAAVPRYMHSDLGASRTWVGIGTTVFFFMALLVRPVVGRLVDRRGRVAFMRWPLVGMTAVALTFGAVDAVWWIIVLRLVQGAFGATYFTAASTVVTDLYPPNRRASAMARLSLNVYVGFVVGPVAADFLVRHSFGAAWVTAAALHGMAFVATFLVPETVGADAGEATTTPAVTRKFQPAVLVPGVAFATTSFAFAAVVAFHVEYAERLGIDRPGWLFATYAGSVVVVRTFIGRAADHYGAFRVAVPCMALGTAALVLLSLARTPWLAFAGMALTGLGSGAAFPALSADAVGRVASRDRGSALGSFMAFGDLGQGAAGPLVGAISTALGFRWVYLLPAILVFTGLAVLARDGRRAVTSAAATPPRPATADPR